MRARRPVVACVATTLLLVAACDTAEDDTAATPPAPQGEEAELAAVQRSGVGGTIYADQEGDRITIALRLEGLRSGVEYPAHVHEGRCAAGGAVVVPLGRVTGREDGTGSLTARVDTATVSPHAPAFVQVHGPGGDPVACADLPGHQGGDELTERLDERPAGDTAGGSGSDARGDTPRDTGSARPAPDTAGAGDDGGAGADAGA